ncbi:tail fiber assembly protein [Vibrio parahaemolyticus]|uniref:tail fiber assembly protein n=1 Tax=Vibrio parahaemolyticus TaxID=670 RepID=UPI00301D7D29
MLVSFKCNNIQYVNIPVEQLDNFELTDLEKNSIIKEAEWRDTKKERDALLFQCDWTQMPDAQLDEAKKIEFLTYRQDLRDIPQTYSNPGDVVWPIKPTI